jgi:uncharacterized repeat protein (TIGR01451 family)
MVRVTSFRKFLASLALLAVVIANLQIDVQKFVPHSAAQGNIVQELTARGGQLSEEDWALLATQNDDAAVQEEENRNENIQQAEGEAPNAALQAEGEAAFAAAVTAKARLNVDKTVNAESFAGGQVTYTYKIWNSGTGNASTVTLHDFFFQNNNPNSRIAPPFTFVSSTGATCTLSSNVFKCPIGSLAVNETKTVTMTFNIPANKFCDQTIMNQADVHPGTVNVNGVSNWDKTMTTVRCTKPRLVVDKTVNAEATAGGQVTYTLKVSNTGNAAAANVIAYDFWIDNNNNAVQINPPFTFVSSTGSTCTFANKAFACPIGNLAPNETKTVTLTFNIPANQFCNQTFMNQSDVHLATGPDTAVSNWDKAQVVVRCNQNADLSITKTGASSVIRGNTILYQILVSNQGPGTAQNIVVRDFIPAGLTFNSATGPTACSQNGSDIVCNEFSLASGQNASFTLTFNVPTIANCSQTVQIQNTAKVTSATADTNTGNNTSQVVTTSVNCPATQSDVSVTKVGPAAVTRGNTFTYSLTVQNTGPDSATNVVLIDFPTSGQTFVPAQSDSRCGLLGDGTIQCGLGTMAVGQQTVMLVFTTQSQQTCSQSTVSNRARVSASNDSTPSDFSNTVTTTVNCPAPTPQCRDGVDNDGDGKIDLDDPGCTNENDDDETDLQANLKITKTGPASVVRGGTITYTLTATNQGPGTANAVVIADAVPAGLTFNAQGTTAGCTLVSPLACPVHAGTPGNAWQNQTNKYDVNNDGLLTIADANVVISKINTNGAGQLPVVKPANEAFVDVSGDGFASAIDALTIINWINSGCISNPTPRVLCSGFDLTNGQTRSFNVVFNVPAVQACTQTSVQNTATISSSSFDASIADNISQLVSTTVTCPSSAPQCSDGIDNDNDGATDFPADFSCSGTDDNDETNPKAQCQDGIDNDNDGAIDFPLDPGCTGKQDNDETNTTGGGADLTISKIGPGNVTRGGTITYTVTVTNLGPGTAQTVVIGDIFPVGLTFNAAGSSSNCVLNADGKSVLCNNFSLVSGDHKTVQISFNIPTIANCATSTISNTATVSSSTTDPVNTNNISSAVVTTINCPASTPQCSDGIDNDNDGATDFPADFSCSGPTDDDETNPRAQCQDGLDNDNDGFTDFPLDPGCTGKQDNDETNTATLPQCSDGIDNDNDGATDFPADFSCSSSTDNDETNPKAQCQDGLDNDNDGFIDFPLDPGCTGKQDNNETNATATADVSISKGGPAAITRGNTITYTVIATNLGPATATNVVIADPVPAGLTFNAGLSTGCVLNGGQTSVLCNNFNLNNGESRSFNIVFNVPTIQNCTTGTIQNTATIATSSTDPVSSNNTSQTVHTTVNCPTGQAVDLSITKLGNSATVNRGSQMAYTLKVQNLGSVTATNVVINDPIPNGLQYVSANGTGVTCTASTSSVSCNLGSITSNTAREFTLTFNVPTVANCTPTTINNQATVSSSESDSNTTNNTSANVATPVQCSLQQVGCIDVIKEVFDTNGNQLFNVPAFTFTLDGTRSGTNSTTGGLRFTDVAVGTHTVIESVANGWTLQSVSPNNGTVTVSAGSSCAQIYFRNRQTSGGGSANGFTVDVTDGETELEPGDDVRYTIKVKNTQNSNVSNATLTVTLDDEVEFDDCSPNCSDNGRIITFNNLSFSTNEEKKFRIDGFVDDDADDGDELRTTAQIGNATDTDTTDVEEDDVDSDDDDEDAEIDLMKDANTSEVFPGGIIEYTIRIRNTGDGELQDLEVVDHLPAGVSVIDDGDADSRSGNMLTWEIDSLDENKDWTVRYRVSVNVGVLPGTILRNEVNVTDDDDDIDESEGVTVSVIGNLPQTGFDSPLAGSSIHLRPINNRNAPVSLPLSVIISIIGLGIGSGASIGRKFLFGI